MKSGAYSDALQSFRRVSFLSALCDDLERNASLCAQLNVWTHLR